MFQCIGEMRYIILAESQDEGGDGNGKPDDLMWILGKVEGTVWCLSAPIGANAVLGEAINALALA